MSQHSSYGNPIYAIDFPDPGIFLASEGFYAYGSQGLGAEGQNIQVAFAPDGVHWQALGDALPQKANWASTQDYWAPHLLEKAGRYYLFYNAKTDFAGQGIGVAVGDSPAGPFVDSGKPLVYGESYINIDAYAFEDNGKYWLCWGSCYQPIKLRQLAESLLEFTPDSTTIEILAPEANHPFAALQEAPWIQRRFDPLLQKTFYYLFTSGANAFGADSYGIMVARSEALTGPYTTLAEARNLTDSVILRGNESFVNPGAHAMFTDKEGQDWLLYHAYLRAGLSLDYESLRQSPRVLMLDPLYYDEEGWPYTQTDSPSTTQQNGPAF